MLLISERLPQGMGSDPDPVNPMENPSFFLLTTLWAMWESVFPLENWGFVENWGALKFAHELP